MKKQSLLIILLILSGGVSVQASQLGKINLAKEGDLQGIHDNITFCWATGWGEPDYIYYDLYDPFYISDIGTSRIVDSTAQGFNGFASIVTNGENDIILHLISGGGHGGYEEYWITKFFETGKPDFYGYRITEIEVTLNDMTLDSPGNDPYGDGFWTSYTYDVTYSFYGEPIPEPATLTLLALGGLLLRKRK